MNRSTLTDAKVTTQERSPAATPASSAAAALAPRLGNHYLQRLLQSRVLQAKLTVNDPGDAFEQEADRPADQVMRMAEPASVQRKSGGCEVRRTAQAAPAAPRVDTAAENSMATLSGRGSGRP